MHAPGGPLLRSGNILSESTRPLRRTDRTHCGPDTRRTHPLPRRPPHARLQATMSLGIGAAVAPHNGLELSCPAEAGSSSLLYGLLAGETRGSLGPARRVSFSELLGRTQLGDAPACSGGEVVLQDVA